MYDYHWNKWKYNPIKHINFTIGGLKRAGDDYSQFYGRKST